MILLPKLNIATTQELKKQDACLLKDLFYITAYILPMISMAPSLLLVYKKSSGLTDLPIVVGI